MKEIRLDSPYIKCRPASSDRRLVRGCKGPGWGERDSKGHKESVGDDLNVLYPAWDGGFTSVYN